MKYISAQPDEIRFLWELEVYSYNFIKNGVNPNDIYAIFSVKGNPSEKLLHLMNILPINIFYYEDDRDYSKLTYQPTIRPHILKKFFKEYPNTSDRWFYHDSDIIFTGNGLPNYDDMPMESGWWMSNTLSYLNYDYILSKGIDVVSDICKLFKMKSIILERNNNVTGGCQVILHGVDYTFWEELEIMCAKLYDLSKNDTYYAEKWGEYTGNSMNDYHGLQWWCADMWAIIFLSWKRGFYSNISHDLDFSWASGLNSYNNAKIFHDAGVVGETGNYSFDKNRFKHEVPYFTDFSYINPDSNSKYYAKEIIEAGKYYQYTQ
jgi:hypothetical protein